MSNKTEHVIVPGKKVTAITFKDTELSIELVADLLIKGSINSRASLVTDTSSSLSRDLKDIIAKEVFKE